MRKITLRHSVQVIFFLLFMVALWHFRADQALFSLVGISPVVHIGNSMAYIVGHASWVLILPSIALIVMGIFAGRLFCFWFCPLGCLQDMIPSRCTTAHKKSYTVYILFVLALLSFFSLNVIGSFDPLVLISRAASAFSLGFCGMSILLVSPVLIIIVVSVFSKRWWCWQVCPLGAFFEVCRRLRMMRAEKKNISQEHVNLERRRAMGTVVASVAAGMVLKMQRSAYADTHLIRPPGALAEIPFKNACIRCGECMKVCITQGLKPSVWESGWDGVGTPMLVPRSGECSEYCTRCGAVCPTGALPKLSLEKKRDVRMGVAVVDKKKCLGWEHDQHCFICGEFCPYLALDVYKKEGGIPCPIVKEDVCRGCGQCEKQCPTWAIRVKRITDEK